MPKSNPKPLSYPAQNPLSSAKTHTYDVVEALLAATILLRAEFCAHGKRLFKISLELLVPSLMKAPGVPAFDESASGNPIAKIFGGAY